MDTPTLVDDIGSWRGEVHNSTFAIVFDVVVACWVRTTTKIVYLVYRYERIDEKGLAHAYREAYQILRSWTFLGFTWQIKLVEQTILLLLIFRKTQILLTDTSSTISHRTQLGDLQHFKKVYYLPLIRSRNGMVQTSFRITYVREISTIAGPRRPDLASFFVG